MIDWRSRKTLVASALAAACLLAACFAFVLAQRRATRQQPASRPRRAAAAPAAQATRTLRQGDDLQAALDAARPGDTITLEAGATFVGPFTLNAKRGEAFITVRSSALSELPPEGVRVTPAHAPLMPKLVSPGGGRPALRTAPGAHHFRFVGVEFGPRDERASVVNLVELGDGSRAQDAAEEVPRHFVFDRCLVRGGRGGTLRRGFALNSAHTEIVNSHVADCKERGGEAQAVLGWNGPGPFRLVNNYLEAAGENVMFGGGGDPSIRGLVPADIEVLGNHFRKPPEWRGAWTVKNLFELKNARRVRVEDNLFEYNWADAQAGVAIVFTPRNQEGSCPWCVVEEVTFRNNVVRHAGGGVQILGRDDIHRSEELRRVRVVNNLFEDIDGARWGGYGLFLQISGGAEVEAAHNTVLQSQHVVLAYGEPTRGFVFRDNLVRHNDYGLFGNGVGVGAPALARYFPQAVFVGNLFVGESRGASYPSRNFFTPTLRSVGFAGAAAGDYRLAADSPFRRRASDGTDPGCDWQALAAALKAAEGVYADGGRRP